MSVLPVKKNLTAWSGGTFRKHITVYQGVDTNSPVRDFTNCTASMIIEDPDTHVALKTLTTENGGITLGGTAGTIDLYISDEDTATFTWPVGLYILYVIEANGDSDPISHGQFIVKNI